MLSCDTTKPSVPQSINNPAEEGLAKDGVRDLSEAHN